MAYSVLGFLLARARALGRFEISARTLIVWSVFGSVFYGVFDEIHQLFIPNREFSFFDMLADLCGGLAGWFYFWGYRYVIQKCGGTKIY